MTLDAHYYELIAGCVPLIEAETAFNTLKAKSAERRNGAFAVAGYTLTCS